MTVRTVISLSQDDKAWLDEQARLQHVSMTELVRRAVRNFRQQQEMQSGPSLQQALAQTANTWPGGDGLAHQAKLRDEWTPSP